MFNKFSRRTLARMFAGSAAVFSLSRTGLGAESTSTSLPGDLATSRSFPKDFLWGAGTSSYQVEGAVREADRGASIWDTFSHAAGNTHNGDTGDIADDFFHRYKEDIQTMKDLGLKTFRFSIAWSRVFPNGRGAPNPQGLDFYNRMVDALLEAGIEPFCTLYHWDLPQALQDKGGWENRDTAKAFADYAGYTAGKLCGKIKRFITVNEMRTFVEQGYALGTHAPGLKLDAARVAQLSHFCSAWARPGSTSHSCAGDTGYQGRNCRQYKCDLPCDRVQGALLTAARKADARRECHVSSPSLRKGAIQPQYLKRLGVSAPKFTAEEMKIISSPMDFVGINIYQPTYVRADDSEMGYAVIPPPASYPHMNSSLAHHRSRSNLLGAEAGRRSVESQRDVRDRERCISGGSHRTQRRDL